MNANPAKHLWESPAVRHALKKEAVRLLWFVLLYVGAAALSRYIRDKPLFDGILSASIGAVAVGVIWLISAVRTFRAALRQHDLVGK